MLCRGSARHRGGFRGDDSGSNASSVPLSWVGLAAGKGLDRPFCGIPAMDERESSMDR